MNQPASRTMSLLAVVTFLAFSFASPALATRGDDDELQRRIDDASVKVRADRPWPSPAASGDMPAGRGAESAAVYHSRCCNRWTFSITPFFWTPGVSGTLAANGISIEVDKSIGEVLEDVFDNFDFVGMAHLEARCNRWSFLFDIVYIDIGNSEDVGPGVVGHWDFETTIPQFMVGYRFVDAPLGCGSRCFRPRFSLDALAGLRYYDFEVRLDLDPGPATRRHLDWADPIVGLRAQARVSPWVTLSLMGNVGGFGVGSELSWQLVASVDWQIAPCFSLNAGWAILDFDYEDGSRDIDLQLSGPFLGVTFRF